MSRMNEDDGKWKKDIDIIKTVPLNVRSKTPRWE